MRREQDRCAAALIQPLATPVPYTWLRQVECVLPAPARRKPEEVGRRSPAQVGDRSGMIPRHAPRPPLPACPLSHRPRPGPHPIRCPAPSRGAGAASPAPRSGAESRQASLAAGGSPPARRLEPALAAIELGCPATQTGDPAPLAPGAGPSQVGRLCRTPTTARFCSASRATGAGLEARSGEPILGLPTHPG